MLVGIRVDAALLVSNYPERVFEPGVFIDQPLPNSRNRFLYYHHGETNRYFLLLSLHNTSNKSVELDYILHQSGPAADGIYAGHTVTDRFLTDLTTKRMKRLQLEPNQRITLIQQTLKPAHICTGLMEIYSPHYRDITIKFAAVDVNHPALDGVSTFKTPGFQKLTMQQSYEYRYGEPIFDISLGENRPRLIDSQYQISLEGHYGMFYDYTVRLKNPSSKPGQIDLLLSPSSGPVRGVFVINKELIKTSLLGANYNYQPMTLKSFLLKPNETKLVEILTMPEPGSNYPVRLVLKSQ